MRKKRANQKISLLSYEEWKSKNVKSELAIAQYIAKHQSNERDVIKMLKHNQIIIPIFTTTVSMLMNKDIYGLYEYQIKRLKLLGEEGYETATELARDIWWLLNKHEYRRDEDEIRSDESVLAFSSKPLQNVIEIDSIDELLKYA